MSEHMRYRLIQWGEVVAQTEGPAKQAYAEICRYAVQYTPDGPCAIERWIDGEWTGKDWDSAGP